MAAAIELTRTEFLLLELFLLNPRQVLTRSLIYERVWGYDFGPPRTRSTSTSATCAARRRRRRAAADPDRPRRRVRAARAVTFRAALTLVAARGRALAVVVASGRRTSLRLRRPAPHPDRQLAERARAAVRPASAAAINDGSSRAELARGHRRRGPERAGDRGDGTSCTAQASCRRRSTGAMPSSGQRGATRLTRRELDGTPASSSRSRTQPGGLAHPVRARSSEVDRALEPLRFYSSSSPRRRRRRSPLGLLVAARRPAPVRRADRRPPSASPETATSPSGSRTRARTSSAASERLQHDARRALDESLERAQRRSSPTRRTSCARR